MKIILFIILCTSVAGQYWGLVGPLHQIENLYKFKKAYCSFYECLKARNINYHNVVLT